MSSTRKLRQSKPLMDLASNESMGKLSPAWETALARDAMLTEARILVDIRLSSGEAARFAMDPVTLTSEGGDILFASSLVSEPVINEYAEVGSSSAAARDLQLSVSRDSLDISKIVGMGSFIAGAGEVSIAIDGMAYTDRIVLMRGVMSSGLAYGDAGESIQITLKDPRALSEFEFPSEAVSKDTHPSAPEASMGSRYPIVYNQWASVPCVRLGNTPIHIECDASMISGTPTLTSSITSSKGDTIQITGKVEVSTQTGFLKIGNELIRYNNTYFHPTINTQLFFTLERGFGGTTRDSHSAGTAVSVGTVVYESEWMVASNEDLEIETDNNSVSINNPIFPDFKWINILRAGLRDSEGTLINIDANPVVQSVSNDAHGNTYTTLTFAAPTTWDEAFYLSGQVSTDDKPSKRVSWDEDSQLYAEVTSPRRLTIPNVVGEVLTKGTALGVDYVDLGAISTIESAMHSIYPSIIADGGDRASSTGATEFVESTILSQFPMLSPLYSGGKYSLRLMDHRVDPVHEFVEGIYPCIERESMVVESPISEACTEYTMRYRYDHLDDSYKSVATLNNTNNALCEKTSSEIGSISHPVIECISIDREEDALYVLDWMAAHYARPSYTATYCFSPWALINLSVGDTIRMTDEDAGFQSCRAIVEAISFQQGKCSVELRVYPPITGIID